MQATKQLRVLHVNRAGFIGGVERVILTIGMGLTESPYQVHIACPKGELAVEATARGIEVHTAPFGRIRVTGNPFELIKYPLSLFNASRLIKEICSKFKIDLIHAHHPVSAICCLPAMRSLGLRLILHVHDGLPVKPAYWLTMIFATSIASRIICVSHAARLVARNTASINSKLTIIYNGVDPHFLNSTPPAASDVVGPGPHIGVFGVIEPRKGQHVFLQAAVLLAAQLPDAHFWVIGGSTFKDKSSYGAKLQEMSNREPLAGRVTFTGYRKDIANLMQAMHVVTLTSVSHETLGMVLLEALALGRPVVTSNVGATAEVVLDGITGIVVPPGDPVSLARGISRALGPDGSICAGRASEDIKKRFSPDVFCRSIGEVYSRTLGHDASKVRSA